MEPTVTVPISVVLRSPCTNFINKVYIVITKRNNDNAKIKDDQSKIRPLYGFQTEIYITSFCKHL